MSKMTKQIQILIILFSIVGYSQEYKEVNFSELDYTYSKDSVTVTVSLNGELLDGKFRVKFEGDDEMLSGYSFIELVKGKAEGKTEFYRDGILIMTSHFKDGMRHGLNIVYDNSGEQVISKIKWVNGKKHGLVWFRYSGYRYYIMGDEVSKEQFEEYERTHKEN